MSLVISVLSICISILTAWLTLFRRGSLAMTKPAALSFEFDNPPPMPAKIVLRALLYSTAVRGQIVEGMFAKLDHKDSSQTFGFWVYFEGKQPLLGSGLYVGQTGVAVDHHFVLSVNQPAYEFASGEYEIEIFARLVGERQPVKLSSASVSVTDEHALVLSRRGRLLFEINPNGQDYVAHAQTSQPHR
ncbi:MAG: hypothetical protein ACLPWS_13840 [Rhodomicrobium sp.]